MPKPDYPSFSEFFESVHGFTPYHWQLELARFTEQHGHLPDRVEVPTGMGKTSTIDVAIWALGQQLHTDKPRTIGQRIVHMVERQIVVDGAYSHVEKLAQALNVATTTATATVATALQRLNPLDDQPLRITSFHGSRRDQRSWLEFTGAQVIVTTATQTTLRLLCHPPAISKRTSSIHAGLLGLDSVLLFDEPHLATAQVHTLQDVLDLQRAATQGIPGVPATTLTLLGATVPPHLHDSDVSRISFHPDKESTHAQQLWRAPKPLHLVETEGLKGKPLLDALFNHILATVQTALEDENLPNPKIAVILNSILAARQAHIKLEALLKNTNVSLKLVTSRTRPADRAEAKELFPDTNVPQIVVSTQTLEVGADFSVDKLITELAPWPVLAQRLGRLNRDGHSTHPLATLIIPTDPDDNLGTPASRHIYGVDQLNATGHGLLGIDNLDNAALRIQPTILSELIKNSGADALWPTPPRRAGLPFELALLLFSSSTPPGTRTDLTAWLHGPDTLFPVEPVTVMWRDHPGLISQCPPLPAEQVEVTISEAISLVMGRELSAFSNDVGVPDQPSWAGKDWDYTRLTQVRIRRNNEWVSLTSLREITPGSTIVLGTEMGGYEATFGVLPGSDHPVPDVSFRISRENGFSEWTVCPADAPLTDIVTNPELSAAERRSIIAQLLKEIYDLNFLPQVRLINEHILIRQPFTINTGGKRQVYLDDHSTLTRDLARLTAQVAGAHQELIEAAAHAAFLHDHAKATPGFQRKLGNMGDKRLLAKSEDGQQRRNLITQLPENYDHALAAARAAEALGFDDLVCHLIGSHHGGVRGTHRGQQNTAIWVDRYRELSQRFGPWGLAWLEATVRLADWRASRSPETASSPEALNQDVIDWLTADDGAIRVKTTGKPVVLTGLAGPPLTLNWYAAIGALALASMEDPQARISWHHMTPLLHTTTDVPGVVESFSPMWKKILGELNTKINEAHERFPGYALKTVVEKKKLTAPKLGTKNQRLLLTHQAIEWLATTTWSEVTRPVAEALWQPHQGRIAQINKLVDSEDPTRVISNGIYELPIPMLAKNSSVFEWPVDFDSETVWNPSHGYSDVTALRGAGGLDLPEEGTDETALELRSRSGLLPLALFGALSLGPGLEAGGRGTVSEFLRNTNGNGSGSVKRRFLKLPLPEVPVTLNGLSNLVHHTQFLTDGRRIHAEYRMRGGEKTVSACGNKIEVLPLIPEK